MSSLLMRPFPSLNGWMLTKSNTNTSDTRTGSYVPASICARYSLQMASTAAGVAAAFVGLNLATISPLADLSAITLSESFHLPANESPVNLYRSRWSCRITPGVTGTASCLSWIMSSTNLYPAISRSSRFFGSAFSAIRSRSLLSEVAIFSILFDALVLCIFATSTRLSSTSGLVAS